MRNGYCETCVGCQRNCLNFKPRAAIHGDRADNDPRHATQRLWFMAMLAGLIVGYYTLETTRADKGQRVYAAALAGELCAAAGAFLMLGALFAVSAYRMAAVFGVAALLLYYGWAGTVLVEGIGTLAQVPPAPDWLVLASRLIGLPIVWGVSRASTAGERAYKTLEQTDAVRIYDSRLKAISAATGSGGLIDIHETRSGKRFVAPRPPCADSA